MDEDLLGGADHGEGLARALCVPDQAGALHRVQGTLYPLLDRPRLVLAEDDLPQLVVALEEDDPVPQEPEEALPREEPLHLALEVTRLVVLPVEEALAVEVPGGAG